MTVIAVGDIMMGSDFPVERLPVDQGSGLLIDVVDTLRSADLTLGNLEGTLLQGGVCTKNPSKGKVYAFRTPPAFAQTLVDGGFDFLNLANNHMNDFGPSGVESTKQTLLAHGIQFAGPGGMTATFQLGRIAAVGSTDTSFTADTSFSADTSLTEDTSFTADTSLIEDTGFAADTNLTTDTFVTDDSASTGDSTTPLDTALTCDSVCIGDSTVCADSATGADSLSIAVASFATSPGADVIFDVAEAQRKVALLAREHDIVIVSFHGGAEGLGCLHTRDESEYFLGQARGNVVRFARAVIDSGADLVWGHGPHVPRAIELYKDRLIAYSLGNFCTYGFNTSGELGYAPMLEAVLDTSGVFMHGRIISALQTADGSVRIDTLHRAANLIRRLSAEDFPASSPVITSDGAISVGSGLDY